MAKLRKCKLVWAAVDAEEVVGYKLYWTHGPVVDYDCDAIFVGKVSEIVIPECVDLAGGPVMFGITALDQEGNESDMTTLDEAFQLHAPQPPQRLRLATADEHIIRKAPAEEEIEPEVLQRLIAQLEDREVPAQASPPRDPQDEDEEISARFDIGSIF